MNATTPPDEASTPRLRLADRPTFSSLTTVTNPSRSPYSSLTLSYSSSLPSETKTTSTSSYVWERRLSKASRRSSRRSTVWQQTTTDTLTVPVGRGYDEYSFWYVTKEKKGAGANRG
jgi:hypothetical protein